MTLIDESDNVGNLPFESARIACDFHLTTYDASYLALATLTKSSIASLDKNMVKAARKLQIPRTGLAN